MPRPHTASIAALVFAATIFAAAHQAAAQDAKGADAAAAEMVDAAMAPCFHDVSPTYARQMRDMLLIRARALAGDRALTRAEQDRAEGTLMSIEDIPAFEALGCVGEGASLLADWASEIRWTGLVTPDTIDPDAEAKRVAKICTWGTGASVRDRYAGLLAKYLRWQFVAKLEKRELDSVERPKLAAAQKALGVIPQKVTLELRSCVIETTKGTPVELRLTESAQQKKTKK
jgi:hypothetical protein